MKIAYFDCFAGAGGDMIVGAMLDAGLDRDVLVDQIASLGIDGLEITVSSTMRAGIHSVKFEPVFPHQHVHRELGDIAAIINASRISDSAKKRSIAVFEALAVAEGTVHGKRPEDVHFHEVGAVDSIVDIVSACVGLEMLRIDSVYCSRLPVGSGTVKCAHGVMPVPAPATLELLKGANVPVTSGPAEKELLTPTAAALLINFVDHFEPMPEMEIVAVGYGAGTFDHEDFANVTRLTIGETVGTGGMVCDSVSLLETNVDDVSSEVIGHVTEKLLACGALDVYCTAIQMKHNRPAVKISILCQPGDVGVMQEILFSEGVTVGIRKQSLSRDKLPRKIVKVETCYGEIRIKVCKFNGEVVSCKAEYADCAKAAAKRGVSVKTVKNTAEAEWLSENPG